MKIWRRVGGTLAAVALLWSAVALAQEATPEPLPADARARAEREALGEVLDLRSQGNDATGEAQQRIDTISDETDDLLARYRTALKQIDAIDQYNRQMLDLIAAQDAEIGSFDEQLDRVDLVSRSVTPLMLRMIDALEVFVELDVPFLIEDRQGRIGELRKLMGRSDVSTSEKYRQIMESYQIEIEYGRTIEAYRSSLTLGSREVTVDFLRFGRIALVYQTLDETERGMWDLESRSWQPLDDDYRSSIRQGLRIARKQVAPDLIRLPLPAAQPAQGKS